MAEGGGEEEEEGESLKNSKIVEEAVAMCWKHLYKKLMDGPTPTRWVTTSTLKHLKHLKRCNAQLPRPSAAFSTGNAKASQRIHENRVNSMQRCQI